MKLYLAVTKDEYELPYAIADTQADLARILGVDPQSVRKAFYDMRNGRGYKRTKYREVEIDEEYDDE